MGVKIRKAFFNESHGQKLNVEKTVKNQNGTYALFQEVEKSDGAKLPWDSIADHKPPIGGFDWWMFPVEQSSQREHNVHNQQEVDMLKNHPTYFPKWKDSVRIVLKSMGWDVHNRKLIEDEKKQWQGWDIRLG